MGICGSAEVKEPLLEGGNKIGSGSRLEDEYKVVGGALGYGRVATVREGVHRETGAEVAIKACSKKVLSSRPDRISRTSEVEALLRVWEGPTTCRHIIQLHGTYEDANYLYVVTELARGGDLFQNMAAKETFSEEDAARLGQQLLEAVRHCHACGVVHRDLKPENILLMDMDGIDIKLVDFGSAAIVAPGEVLRDFMATPFYAAPEVWERAYGAAADVWSVGAVLFVLLTGLPPTLSSKMVHSNDTWKDLQAGKVTGLPPSTSPALLDLLGRLLEPNPEERITPAGALDHPWITGGVPRGTENLEGSMRGIRAYARVRKFQKAAVVLLSVLVDSKELRTLARRMRVLEQTRGSLREVELEKLLEDLGLVSQASSLRQLRRTMLGGGPKDASITAANADSEIAVEFAVDDFLDILECRKMALKHLNKERKLEDSSHGTTPEMGLDGIVTWLHPRGLSVSTRLFAFPESPTGSSRGGEMSRAKSAGNLGALVEEETSPPASGRYPGASFGSLGTEEDEPAGLKASEPNGKVEEVGRGRGAGQARAGSSVHGEMVYRSFLSQARKSRA